MLMSDPFDDTVEHRCGLQADGVFSARRTHASELLDHRASGQGDRRKTGMRGLLGALSIVLAFASPTTLAYDLGQHEWRDRLLVIAAPRAADPAAARQRAVVADRADAIADRALRVFELFEDGGAVDGKPLPAVDVAALRGHFGIEPGARAVLLVGKDGGVKGRAPLDADLRTFFAQIDGMPMRQAEIRAKRAAGEPVTRP
jgi:hypothetical protein